MIAFLQDAGETCAAWLTVIFCYIEWAVISMWSYFIDTVKLMLSVLITAVNLALSVLPTAAIEEVNVEESLIGKINYFIPIPELMAEFTIVMIAWIVYRIWQYLLRWGRADY